MPCNNISDVLELTIGSDDKIVDYSLTKLSCGGAVPASRTIKTWLSNITIDELLEVKPEQFLDAHPTDDEVLEYLLLKHFFSARAGAAAILGKDPFGAEGFCTIETISQTSEGLKARASIKIDAITDEIKSCGRCCGSKNPIPRKKPKS